MAVAYRGKRRRRGQGERARPHGQHLSGETGLITAFLRQVVDDFAGDHPLLRAEAAQFLEDRAAVRFWCSLVDLDDTAFLERAAQLQGARGPG
jgi:hypothetical protein